jgi:hypothetical protein
MFAPHFSLLDDDNSQLTGRYIASETSFDFRLVRVPTKDDLVALKMTEDGFNVFNSPRVFSTTLDLDLDL